MSQSGRWFSVADVADIVIGRNIHYSALQVRILRAKYPEVAEKIISIKFPGRGPHNTSATDLVTAVEVMMLLPGERAELVRAAAARLFVRYHGGDFQMIEEMLRRREVQAGIAQAAAPADGLDPALRHAGRSGGATEPEDGPAVSRNRRSERGYNPSTAEHSEQGEGALRDGFAAPAGGN